MDPALSIMDPEPPLAAAAERWLLDVRELCVDFHTAAGAVRAVDRLSFRIAPGRSLAIIGESGSGKTASCRAIMGLLPHSASISGSVRMSGKELLGQDERQMRRHRGRDIAVVFQDPARSLNPTMRVGYQITEALRLHHPIDRAAAQLRAIELLEQMRVPAAKQRFFAYPHELSGGMRQRVVIAIAIAGNPKILIADEATRSLDSITQAETVRLLQDLQRELSMTHIMISHDLQTVSSFADELLVMYAGRAVDRGPTAELLRHTQVPYTRALLAAVPTAESLQRPRLPTVHGRMSDGSPASRHILQVQNVSQEFRVRRHDRIGSTLLHAVSNVSFHICYGETLGMVGESGSGKSTLARSLLQTPRPRTGTVRFEGAELTALRGRALHTHRRSMQMVFQDPFGSLNPRWRVVDLVEEPLVGYGVGNASTRQRRVSEVLDAVGLSLTSYGRRLPRELSGGQCQRVAIARALTLDPSLIICDEAVSALDALIQAQLLNLLQDLQQERGLSYLFISHDLAVVKQVSDRVAVLFMGQLCEIGPASSIYTRARHPYTAMLLAAAPRTALLERKWVPGAVGLEDAQLPSLRHPGGCCFLAQCPRAQERCSIEVPTLRDMGENHLVACHYPEVADAQQQTVLCNRDR
jgi:oligopeptide/dipeptide ABC transporter ATP-binding protein